MWNGHHPQVPTCQPANQPSNPAKQPALAHKQSQNQRLQSATHHRGCTVRPCQAKQAIQSNRRNNRPNQSARAFGNLFHNLSLLHHLLQTTCAGNALSLVHSAWGVRTQVLHERGSCGTSPMRMHASHPTWLTFWLIR
jgi:hypothetical protein